MSQYCWCIVGRGESWTDSCVLALTWNLLNSGTLEGMTFNLSSKHISRFTALNQFMERLLAQTVFSSEISRQLKSCFIFISLEIAHQLIDIHNKEVFETVSSPGMEHRLTLSFTEVDLQRLAAVLWNGDLLVHLPSVVPWGRHGWQFDGVRPRLMYWLA